MNKNVLGKGWYRPNQYLYYGLLGVLAAAILFFTIALILGHSMAIPWNTVAQGEAIAVTMDYVNVGPFRLPIVLDNFLLTEYFEGGSLDIKEWPSYAFLAFMALVFSVILAVITAFKRFWYLVGMAFVIVFLLNLKLEMLQLFGMFNKVGLIISFTLFLPISYYFHSVRTSTNLLNRFLIFMGLTTVFGIIIYLFAEVQSPFLYITHYGYVAPIILSIVFILLVGNEIVTGFVYVTSRENVDKNKKNLTHFLVITSIYLVNLGLLFFDKFLYLNLGIDFIHPYLLLVVSAVLGFIFYPLKEKSYGNIYRYYPSGALLFACLATVCFFTIGYYTYTANDPVLEVFKKFVLYGHLGYGLMFLVYILANFITPYVQGLPIYKVLYDPQYMPYFTFRFAGTIATLALFLVSNYEVPLFQTISSYYNGLGDLHSSNNEVRIAEVYYRKGAIYGYNNHRSNYALASIARSEGDNAKAAYHFNLANQLRPTEQSFVNMSNVYIDVGKPFQALFTLQEGLEKFPSSTYLKNNLGLLYNKVGEEDSAFVMFDEVNSSSDEVSSNAGLNLLNLVAKGNYDYNTDSLINAYGSRKHLSSLNNVAVLYNINNQHDPHEVNVDLDSALNLISGYSLINRSLNGLYGNDSINTAYLNGMAAFSANNYFNQQLRIAAALGNNKNGNTYQAFIILNEIASNDYTNKGRYYDLIGLLALQHNSPRLATEYFELALVNNYQEAKQHLGISFMEFGWEEEAKEIWNELTLSGDPAIRNMATNALSLYEIDPLDSQLSDAQRYLAWRYQIAKNDQLNTEMISKAFNSKEYRVQFLLDFFEYHISQGNYSDAISSFKNINPDDVGNSLMDRYLTSELQFVDLIEDEDKLVQLSNVNENKGSTYNQLYYMARIAEMKGDTALANNYYERFTANSVFEEQKLIHVAKYFEKHDPFKAYNILQKAIEVNKYSASLLKAYILQCARLEFELFAEHALQELREVIPGQAYILFEEEFRSVLEKTKQQSGYFEE